MNGSPATGISDFGIVSVTGRIRLARPPARMATGIIGSSISLGDYLGAFKVELEADFGQSGLAHGLAQPRFLFRVEHQEAAAAGADQLAADSAVVDGDIVPG